MHYNYFFILHKRRQEVENKGEKDMSLFTD